MKNLKIETSVREAKEADFVLREIGMNDSFIQEASNLWVLPEYDEEEFGEYLGDDYAIECLTPIKEEIEAEFKRHGMTEFEVVIFQVLNKNNDKEDIVIRLETYLFTFKTLER